MDSQHGQHHSQQPTVTAITCTNRIVKTTTITTNQPTATTTATTTTTNSYNTAATTTTNQQLQQQQQQQPTNSYNNSNNNSNQPTATTTTTTTTISQYLHPPSPPSLTDSPTDLQLNVGLPGSCEAGLQLGLPEPRLLPVGAPVAPGALQLLLQLLAPQLEALEVKGQLGGCGWSQWRRCWIYFLEGGGGEMGSKLTVWDTYHSCLISIPYKNIAHVPLALPTNHVMHCPCASILERSCDLLPTRFYVFHYTLTIIMTTHETMCCIARVLLFPSLPPQNSLLFPRAR